MTVILLSCLVVKFVYTSFFVQIAFLTLFECLNSAITNQFLGQVSPCSMPVYKKSRLSSVSRGRDRMGKYRHGQENNIRVLLPYI